METSRRLHQSKLADALKYNERMIETLTRSVESIRAAMTSSKDAAFYEIRIEQTLTSIRHYEAKNEELRTKLAIVLSGGCDREIVLARKKAEDEKQKQFDEAKKKEELLKAEEEIRKQQGKEFFQKEMSEDRRDHQGVKTFERFREICSSAPDYIINNIKTMPNNKGYKFRGVVFFGEMPEEQGAPLVIFEKKPAGMFITETYKDKEITYFKGKIDGQKKLVRKFHLERRDNGPALRTQIL